MELAQSQIISARANDPFSSNEKYWENMQSIGLLRQNSALDIYVIKSSNIVVSYFIYMEHADY